MNRNLDDARMEIEEMLHERAATCAQIDVVKCESHNDLMAYVYTTRGDFFATLIELPVPIGHFDPLDLEQQLWPRPRVFH